MKPSQLNESNEIKCVETLQRQNRNEHACLLCLLCLLELNRVIYEVRWVVSVNKSIAGRPYHFIKHVCV
jgi:hypothetical protein